MARFIPGPLAAAISGPLGGLSFVAGSGSGIIRTRPRRSRSLSNAQTKQLTLLRIIQESWASLEEDAQLAWRQAAAQITFTDSLGVARHLSGYHLYLYVQGRRGYPPQPDDIPTALRTLPALTLSLTSSVATSTLQLSWTTPEVAARWYHVFAGRTLSSSPYAEPRSRKLIWVQSGLFTTRNLWGDFAARFGAPIAGETVRFWLQRSWYFSLPSPEITASFTVGA
jgi:hypothetical protein